jgi:hypothetical protein
VADERCDFVLATAHPDDQFYLVLGSLARQGGPFQVSIQTKTTADRQDLPLVQPEADPAWVSRMRQQGARLDRARQQRLQEEVNLTPAAPQRERVFHLFTGQSGLEDSASYTAIRAELRGVGRHCQVYVDRSHSDPAAFQPTVDDAVRAFDNEIYPKSTRWFGRPLDVDRDGRFTILFTGWLTKVQNGKAALGGFVRGSDFYRDLEAPFSNRCDMMYLSTELAPGPYLRTLIAHEYTHTIIFCEHVLGNYRDDGPRRDEESWLNEGLAHLAEEMHGYSWENLDYRISTFLNAPEKYPLVVADYYASGLWRNPGTRGAAYLFLRWCRNQYGSGLPGRLIQSNLAGVENLEAATQEQFAELFRRWSVALLDDESRGANEHVRAEENRRPPLARLLCGPRFTEVALNGGQHDLQLAPTAAAYVRLHSPTGSHARVTVTAQPGTDLQVSLVRLPPESARLSLRTRPTPDGKAVQLFLRASNQAVELENVGWERLVQTGKATEDSSYRPVVAGAVRAWFGDPLVKAGETRTSPAIPLPPVPGPVVWKVIGKDASGRRVVAWCISGRTNHSP